MVVKDLMKELRLIVKVHPEAREAEIWGAVANELRPLHYVAYDHKHKPPRMRLED